MSSSLEGELSPVFEWQNSVQRQGTRGDGALRVGGVVNLGISEVTAPETIKKIPAPSTGGVVEQAPEKNSPRIKHEALVVQV
ncbi:hypothetical protein TNCV_4670671 [Trichonephila clavipes]|nr:hypothetical protein TNCV_4670671 [Trichonephila clavipes]